MAIYPWTVAALDMLSARTGKEWSHVKRWKDMIAERAAVGRGYQVLET
jgi:hypothetical protein